MMRYFVLFLIFVFCFSSVYPEPSHTTNHGSHSSVKVYSPITLKQCEKIALSQQPQLLIARAKVLEQKGALELAKSQVYPSLLGTGEFAHNTPTLIAGFGPFVIPIDSSDSFNTLLELQYPLYNGGRLENQVNFAQKGLSKSKFQEKEVKLTVLLNTRIFYYKAVLAKEIFRADRWDYNAQAFNEDSSKELFKTGQVPKLIYRNSVILLRRAKIKVSEAILDYKNSLDNLAFAIGLDPEQIKGVKGNLLRPFIFPSYHRFVQKAYEQRALIKEDKAKLQQARIQLQIAEAVNSPNISLFAAETYSTRPFVPFFPYVQNQAGINISWPFHWGEKGGEVEKAAAGIKDAEEQLRLDKEQIADQIKVAYNNAEQAFKSAQSSMKNVQAGRKSFDNAQAAFANQLIDSAQLDETTSLLDQAQSDYLDSLYNYEVSLSQLKYEEGELK